MDVDWKMGVNKKNSGVFWEDGSALSPDTWSNIEC